MEALPRDKVFDSTLSLLSEGYPFIARRCAQLGSDAYAMVAQGGGEHERNHRCPGEDITVSLVAQAARRLADLMENGLPEQDLTTDLSRIPARPASGIVLELGR